MAKTKLDHIYGNVGTNVDLTPINNKITALENKNNQQDTQITNLSNITAKTNLENTFTANQNVNGMIYTKGNNVGLTLKDNGGTIRGNVIAQGADLKIEANTNSMIINAVHNINLNPSSGYNVRIRDREIKHTYQGIYTRPVTMNKQDFQGRYFYKSITTDVTLDIPQYFRNKRCLYEVSADYVNVANKKLALGKVVFSDNMNVTTATNAFPLNRIEIFTEYDYNVGSSSNFNLSIVFRLSILEL